MSTQNPSHELTVRQEETRRSMMEVASWPQHAEVLDAEPAVRERVAKTAVVLALADMRPTEEATDSMVEAMTRHGLTPAEYVSLLQGLLGSSYDPEEDQQLVSRSMQIIHTAGEHFMLFAPNSVIDDDGVERAPVALAWISGVAASLAEIAKFDDEVILDANRVEEFKQYLVSPDASRKMDIETVAVLPEEQIRVIIREFNGEL